MGRFFDVIKDMAKSFRFLLPLAFIAIVIYMFYSLFTKEDAKKTVEDIVYITTKVREEKPESLFRNFNNDTIVYSNFLPIDLKSHMTDHGYVIDNRFGSTISVMDAYKTKEEKDYYESLKAKSRREYAQKYRGTGAYIITFPKIRRSACMLLAQTDWKSKVPNFLGIEVGRVKRDNPNIGVERLNMGILQGLTEIDYDGPDESFVANRKLQYREAFKACKCLVHNKCIVSLKFY